MNATDRERRVGSLLFNCGGPGCPSAQLVKLVPQTFTARLRRRFDIVGFDPLRRVAEQPHEAAEAPPHRR